MGNFCCFVYFVYDIFGLRFLVLMGLFICYIIFFVVVLRSIVFCLLIGELRFERGIIFEEGEGKKEVCILVFLVILVSFVCL